MGLPTEYIAILITVDWFVDRYRIATNVMSELTVSAAIDGKHQKSKDEAIGIVLTE